MTISYLVIVCPCSQLELEEAGYGSDLESSEGALDEHKQVHAEILAYKQEVTRCFDDKVSCIRPQSVASTL